jgi:hypothetical protein
MRLQADGDFTLGRTIREALSRLSNQTDELEELSDGDRFLFTSALENVDRELEEAAKHLLGCADEVGPAQLRSTLPRLIEQHPGEVLALLELLLEVREGIEARLPTIEYLVTLLSTIERDGRRSIGRDPVTLSPILEQLALDIAEHAVVDTSAFELELFQASALESGDESMAEVAVRMRGMKLELGINCLMPSTLRAIVTYNTRMFNRIHDDLEALRRSDEELGGSDERPDQPLRSGDAESGSGRDEWLAEVENDSSDLPLLEDSEGFGLIAEAMRRRLAGQAIGSCTSERIALSLDVSDLVEEEKDALGEEPSSDGSPGGTLACTVLMGLLLKHVVVLAPELEELGIDPDILETDWVEALDGRLKNEVSVHLSANAYDQACLLSEAKSRHLYSPVSTLKRKRIREAALDSAWEGSGRPGPHMLGTGRAAAIGETHRKQKRAKLRIVLAAIAVGILGFIAIRAGRPGPTPEILHFSAAELNEISRYVISAYRDGHGKGPRIVGSVDGDWLDLELSARIATMRELTERLADDGVEELILYDRENAIHVHAVGGQLRLPRELQTAASAVLSSQSGS